MTSEVVIVGAARTPFGKLLGGLSSLKATELGSHAIKGALAQNKIDPNLVEAVVMGQVLQAGAGQNPAKQAALGAGVPATAHTNTVNKVCLSGLTAVIDAARLIRSGEAEVVVAGGMESMSNAPHLLGKSRTGTKYGDVSMKDHMAWDGLTDAAQEISMGELTEQFSETYQATREEQDEVSANSHIRAEANRDKLAREIVPVTISSRKGDVTVSEDEGIRAGTTKESMAGLRPAFTKDGTITAGSSSPISDGAAAVVLTTRERADKEGWPIMAVLRSVGQVAGPDASLQLQPANAIKKALDREGWTAADLDVVEFNEAFAAVGICSARELGISLDKVNPCGGAIALGHPIGASGARLVAHLAHRLANGEAKKVGASLCGGGGQGEAILLEANP
ncbi:putative acetyl-CoA acetyltransferase [Corynebacterium kalinowskii]|uniref:Probable acetyl-CoA acetyltransferase n=1 Tax=Corynebacterium kalinowskii TaxID=2675216 RepID=A0A6B8VHS0_9CORY|nr:acetyl-CoA C-acetyltransferase [Corynebacterium kalinowskii]QGU01144.1 putative acetyl-CoA acetyltransferase [Corynebacterium kalinowskii]